MISINQIRVNTNKILVLGNHEPIVQSILDFDYLSNHQPSVIVIITGRSGFTKYFWGQSEILIPTLQGLSLPEKGIQKGDKVINVVVVDLGGYYKLIHAGEFTLTHKFRKLIRRQDGI